ncbi:hypothetical protein COCCADRAFT_22456 [Bipolaris zeicola 26-R-13]|uniref:Uncharacterized protein n=1 Tax=Cochliobolus carbonum (strain 26-R-13) TaxID=930089 RepID=W6YKC8_COCC2|nr:uncharacterized protein COCCADRAFT_22456 [Bipolaris zeicola 26-R-13]EUC38110.1 hypothetical protein COCCADRAFT_22456 [Bipolaris zeicola 26-R-13]
MWRRSAEQIVPELEARSRRGKFRSIRPGKDTTEARRLGACVVLGRRGGTWLALNRRAAAEMSIDDRSGARGAVAGSAWQGDVLDSVDGQGGCMTQRAMSSPAQAQAAATARVAHASWWSGGGDGDEPGDEGGAYNALGRFLMAGKEEWPMCSWPWAWFCHDCAATVTATAGLPMPRSKGCLLWRRYGSAPAVPAVQRLLDLEGDGDGDGDGAAEGANQEGAGGSGRGSVSANASASDSAVSQSVNQSISQSVSPSVSRVVCAVASSHLQRKWR